MSDSGQGTHPLPDRDRVANPSLAGLATATGKARRDAPTVAVCDV